MNMDHEPISAIVPVYRGDDPDHFDSALESLHNQTHPPSEVITVAGGPLTPALDDVVADHPSVEIIRLKEDQGQGVSRAAGVDDATHDLVAFLDADDIAVPRRFEHQIERFQKTSRLDALGGYAAEFTDDPSFPHATRKVPITRRGIKQGARFRSPFNTSTVMARRESIVEAGNFRAEEPFEDYRLWMRMLNQGMHLSNMPKILSKNRVANGEGMMDRRGGIEYAREEIELFRDFYNEGYVSAPVVVANLAVRLPIRVLPNRVRAAVYDRLLRR